MRLDRLIAPPGLFRIALARSMQCFEPREDVFRRRPNHTGSAQDLRCVAEESERLVHAPLLQPVGSLT